MDDLNKTSFQATVRDKEEKGSNVSPVFLLGKDVCQECYEIAKLIIKNFPAEKFTYINIGRATNWLTPFLFAINENSEILNIPFSIGTQISGNFSSLDDMDHTKDLDVFCHFDRFLQSDKKEFLLIDYVVTARSISFCQGYLKRKFRGYSFSSLAISHKESPWIAPFDYLISNKGDDHILVLQLMDLKKFNVISAFDSYRFSCQAAPKMTQERLTWQAYCAVITAISHTFSSYDTHYYQLNKNLKKQIEK